ncbi:hypothetical protein CfE428DRAFT_1164 [Chthoniobacter flavus Ellin428]|uniref:Uncharacterized protein n=1 Tax=Chthoniobacter flavus Ellin428 TaxID=497964 RepID=B4CX73_9BACT|nr:hypothetical protein CfE428DRAFT_1164 [Chthoniobacter flavus Ellin428]
MDLCWEREGEDEGGIDSNHGGNSGFLPVAKTRYTRNGASHGGDEWG